MTRIISIYFNGTCDTNDVPEHDPISLAALLHHVTVTDDNNLSICINGCGIENSDIRDLSLVFGFHLEQQVLDIEQFIKEKIDESEDNIVLNIYGFSRGAVAAFLLCQKLKTIPTERLIINVAAFEPVPVNYITSVYGDILFGTNSTLSAAVADLTECININKILTLMTNYPSLDIIGFAPILPALPTTCTSEVDVTPGCHQSAVSFYKNGDAIEARNTESAIVFQRIVEFMQNCGTNFDFERLKLNANLVTSSDSPQLLALYEELAKKTINLQRRPMHLGNSIFTTAGKTYLNIKHQQLSQVEDIDPENCMISIKNRNPQQMSTQQRKSIERRDILFTLAIVLNMASLFCDPDEDVEATTKKTLI